MQNLNVEAQGKENDCSNAKFLSSFIELIVKDEEESKLEKEQEFIITEDIQFSSEDLNEQDI